MLFNSAIHFDKKRTHRTRFDGNITAHYEIIGANLRDIKLHIIHQQPQGYTG